MVVDYAHTPDALERVLTTARKLTPAAGSAWCSAAAATATAASARSWARSPRGSADRVWVTSDNPRTERPEAIVDEIVVGRAARGRRGRARTCASPTGARPSAAALGWAARRRHGGDRGQGPRDLPDHRRRRAAFDDREVARADPGAERPPMSRACRRSPCRTSCAPPRARSWPATSACPVTGVSIDSRALGVGEAFFAIHGHRLDGHAFLADAAARGAACLVVHALPDDVPANVPAGARRGHHARARPARPPVTAARFTIPVVAVTGCNGKTTTKELIGRRARQRWDGAASPSGQLQQPVGPAAHAAAADARAPGGGARDRHQRAAARSPRWPRSAAPTVGVVTTVAAVHTEFLGSLDGVREEKAALVRALAADGAAVLNADDPRVAGHGARDARARA